MIAKKWIRLIILALGILIALPVWQLSGFLLWGLLCGITTMLVLDLTMLRPYSARVKVVCLVIYVVTIGCVLVGLFQG